MRSVLCSNISRRCEFVAWGLARVSDKRSLPIPKTWGGCVHTERLLARPRAAMLLSFDCPAPPICDLPRDSPRPLPYHDFVLKCVVVEG